MYLSCYSVGDLDFLANTPAQGGPQVQKRVCVQVTIQSGTGYDNGQSVTPSFTIDFGGRVAANDPSALYTLSGANRTDVVYDIANGRVFITAYILQTQDDARTIT